MFKVIKVDGSLHIVSGEYTAIISEIMMSKLKVTIIRKSENVNELIEPMQIFSAYKVAFDSAVNRLLELNQRKVT